MGDLIDNTVNPQPETDRLFDLPEPDPGDQETIVKAKSGAEPRLWTSHKARLIERYLYRFVLVTKSGTYIDGFAGPQNPCDQDAWAARLVLESRPAWLQRFHLCDRKRSQVALLRNLKASHPGRAIDVHPGDFNKTIDKILVPELVPPGSPTFCLLDQRMFECHWSTVEKLSTYRKPYKIELFYFFATSWMDRSFARVRNAKAAAWWGRDDWNSLLTITAFEQARVMAKRFKKDLGYKYAMPLAIYEGEGKQGKIMYYMVHGSDHERAPALMAEAYREVVTSVDQIPQPELFPAAPPVVE